MEEIKFYLGTSNVSWLAKLDVPLFISYTRLRPQKWFDEAIGRWSLDSGGFTQLSKYGEWKFTAEEYVKDTRWYYDNIGGMDWASPQDWMCEPWILEKTGQTIEQHQRNTVHNYLELRNMDAGLPFIPVLQGWELEDYLRCIDMYDAEGVDLSAEPVVGLGSVCRRQRSTEIRDIVTALAGQGLRLHGFGVKTLGLAMYADKLVSCDSMAWSYKAAFEKIRLDGCTHKTCNNCITFALQWRSQLLNKIHL